MSKFIVGTTVGLAVGYMVAKMMDENFMDKMNHEVSDLTAKAKKKAKDLLDKGENEAEYVKDRAEHTVEQGKAKLNQAMQ